MTIDQAVDLVLETIETMNGGELNIPDLPAYELVELAGAMGAYSINVIGLPLHEKLHESMDENRCSRDARRMNAQELRIALETI